MNKNLYMIMCHKNLDQVLLLSKTLLTADSDVVVHVDSSVSNDKYIEFLNAIKDIPNLYVTDKRIHGVLDTRTLVDIVFIMLSYVKKRNLTYKNYCLLSGQDFPIKPINEINKNLLANYPTPHIDCTPYDTSNWICPKFQSTPWLLKFRKSTLRKLKSKNPIRKLLEKATIKLQNFLELLKLTSYDKLTRVGVSLYGGSAWWILPDIAIDFIYNEYINSTKIVEYLLETRTPEETFFQIMVMRSPCKNDVHINPVHQVEQTCKTWAYFSDKDKPFTGHPYVFTVNEFDKLRDSSFWFARKFDVQQDNEIIELIQKNLIN